MSLEWVNLQWLRKHFSWLNLSEETKKDIDSTRNNIWAILLVWSLVLWTVWYSNDTNDFTNQEQQKQSKCLNTYTYKDWEKQIDKCRDSSWSWSSRYLYNTNWWTAVVWHALSETHSNHSLWHWSWG